MNQLNQFMSPAPFKGLSVFFYPDGAGPAEVECSVCGAQCLAERGRFATASLVEALAQRAGQFTPIRRDVFTCPHATETWHGQATNLYREAERQVSPRLRELVLADLQELLANQPT